MWSLPKQAGLFILFCTLTSLFPATIQGNEQKAFLTFSGNLVTAELKETPLKLVLNELREKKGLHPQIHSSILPAPQGAPPQLKPTAKIYHPQAKEMMALLPAGFVNGVQ